MVIEHQESFDRVIREGVNLFLGSGFPTYAKNVEGKTLPIGSVLCDELIKEFNCPKINDLSKVCTIIDSFNSEGLKKYLISKGLYLT